MAFIRGDADAFLRGLGLALHSRDELLDRQGAIFDLVQDALDLMDAKDSPDKKTFRTAAARFADEAVRIWRRRWQTK